MCQWQSYRWFEVLPEDTIIWGNDYPHPDGIWPDSLKVLEEDLRRLDAKARRKITCENTAKLYELV
ncbi:MAG: amidohydrolase family protein [Nitrospinae bacterium]|nr:amidohydrolase family protein [Nitrospinota bacterium]